MMATHPKVEWVPPAPRSGFLGEWDKFIGPGASRAENGLILGVSLIGAVFVPWNAVRLGLGWSTVQMIVAGLLALDLFGGVIANASNVTKRWYHRPGQGNRQHMIFVLVHLHPVLVGWLFLGGGEGWWFGISVYIFTVVAAQIILAVPLSVQRPVAFGLTMAGILLGLYALPAVPGMEWFVPVFLMKLLAAHLVADVPFSA